MAGTLIIAGDFTQTGAGSLVMYLSSPYDYNHLVVQGAVSLAGRLTVSTVGGFIPPPYPFNGLIGGTSVSGQLDQTTLPPGRSLRYTSNSVDLI